MRQKCILWAHQSSRLTTNKRKRTLCLRVYFIHEQRNLESCTPEGPEWDCDSSREALRPCLGSNYFSQADSCGPGKQEIFRKQILQAWLLPPGTCPLCGLGLRGQWGDPRSQRAPARWLQQGERWLGSQIFN